MNDSLTGNHVVNYDWIHSWYEPPKEFCFIKEYVKGPFGKSLIIFSDPYVVHNKVLLTGNPLYPTSGIPEPFTDYTVFNCFCLDYLNESDMHKEDVEVVKALRKRYRLYLGQGIPDPNGLVPYIGRPELVTEQEIRNSDRNCINIKRRHCLCCEKNYLFECPDQFSEATKDWKGSTCTCRTCHLVKPPKAPVAKQGCNCIYNMPQCDGNTCKYSKRDKKESLEVKKDDLEHFKKVDYEVKKEYCNKATSYDPNPHEVETVHEDKSSALQSRKTDETQTAPEPPQVSNPEEQPPINSRNKTKKNKKNKFHMCSCFKNRQNSNSTEPVHNEPTHQEPVKQESSPPREQPHSFLLNEINETFSKEVQTDFSSSINCKSVQTDVVDFSHEKRKKTTKKCECPSQCLLCRMNDYRDYSSLCPKYQPLCVGSYKCCNPHQCSGSSHCRYVYKMEDSDESSGTRSSIGQVNCTKRKVEKERLKCNQKMYCCTFLTSASRNPKDTKRAIDEGVQNSKVPYGCNSMSNPFLLSDFFEKPMEKNHPLLNKKLPLINEKFHPDEKNFLKFGSTLNQNDNRSPEYFENYKSNGFNSNFRTKATTTTKSEFCKKYKPLEVKFVKDVRSDESITYGLINNCKARSRSRNRGKKLSGCNNSKTKTNNNKPSLHYPSFYNPERRASKKK